MNISETKLVTLQYKLNVKTEKGSFDLMEETTEDAPLKYFHGMGMMLPKFEEHLEGLAAGDTFEFMLATEDAYGEYDEANVIDLPRNVFTVEGQFDDEKVYPGAIVPLVDSEGNRLNSLIIEVGEETVKVDLNHPLAGEDLYFTGTITEVTQPTDEELHAMMHHGGCGCGCGESENDSCGGGCDGGCCGSCNC